MSFSYISDSKIKLEEQKAIRMQAVSPAPCEDHISEQSNTSKYFVYTLYLN